nr:hypothetical protein [Tanacetum cinerariifolium]
LKYNQKEVDELKAERLAKIQYPLALMANSNNPYAFSAPHQDQSSLNQNYLQQPMQNSEDITDPTTAMNMSLALMAKAFKLNYSTPTNNNQGISSNPRNRQIAQPGQNAWNPAGYNDVIWNQGNGNQNGLIGVQGNENQNQIRNGNLVVACTEGNAAGQNANQIRCYNCRGVGHYARNCTVMPRRRDDIIISDSEHSLVTYTSVPSLVEDYSDIGSPEVNRPLSSDYVPGPEEPEQAPLSLDYVTGLEEPEQAPLSPDYRAGTTITGLRTGPEKPEQAPPLPVYLPYLSKPVYPEYMPPEDDVFPVEEQPLPIAATPTAESPGYILEFDPNGDLEEDEEEDPEEDPADYPVDSTVVALLTVDHVPSEEVTEPLPQIQSPPLPIPSPPPDSPTHIKISESCLPLQKRLRFASPTPSQEVGESSTADAARQNEPTIARDYPYSLVKEELYGFVDRLDVALGRPMSKELGYGITDTWDELVGASEEIAPSTLQGVNQRVTDLSTIVEQETTIMMAREAWGSSMDASDNAHSDVMSLGTTLVAQQVLILDLQAADRRRQGAIKELLAADNKRQAMINQGVTTALAARDANWNGDDSHTSGTAKTMQDAIEFATELMNKKINTWAKRQADNKRKSDDTTKNNHQQPNKRQNTGRAYAAGNGDKRAYKGPRPWCTKCNYHHDGPCAPKCHKCNQFGHLSRDYRNPPIVNTRANQRGNVCFECGAQGHFKRECPKLKNNNNQGNQVGNAKTQAKVYAVGKARANPDNNVVT